jgi:hypothetical protein
MTIYVNFTDGKQTAINATFGCPQDPEVWPNQGTVEEDDARWLAYFSTLDSLTRSMLPTPPGWVEPKAE